MARPEGPAAGIGRTVVRRTVCVAAVVAGLGGCSGLYLGDNPGPDVRKQTGPLTALPEHLRRGGE